MIMLALYSNDLPLVFLIVWELAKQFFATTECLSQGAVGFGSGLERAQQLVLPAEPGEVKRRRLSFLKVSGNEFAVKAFLVPAGVLSEPEHAIDHHERGDENVKPAQERCKEPMHQR